MLLTNCGNLERSTPNGSLLSALWQYLQYVPGGCSRWRVAAQNSADLRVPGPQPGLGRGQGANPWASLLSLPRAPAETSNKRVNCLRPPFVSEALWASSNARVSLCTWVNAYTHGCRDVYPYVYVHMCWCMRVLYKHVRARVHPGTRAYLYVHVHARIGMHMDLCMRTWVWMRPCKCVRAHTSVHLCAYVHTHTSELGVNVCTCACVCTHRQW